VYNFSHGQAQGRSKTKENIMATTFTYEAVTLNGVKGWIATRRIDGVHAGKHFGKTKKAAREAFDQE
jgi:hypothetical protein